LAHQASSPAPAPVRREVLEGGRDLAPPAGSCPRSSAQAPCLRGGATVGESPRFRFCRADGDLCFPHKQIFFLKQLLWTLPVQTRAQGHWRPWEPPPRDGILGDPAISQPLRESSHHSRSATLCLHDRHLAPRDQDRNTGAPNRVLHTATGVAITQQRSCAIPALVLSLCPFHCLPGHWNGEFFVFFSSPPVL
jgi:hypothetical protein